MTDPLPQLRAMLAFERSLVDRVGPPGCAARETAAANVAALEWVLARATCDAVLLGSPDAWDRSRLRGSRLTRDKASPPVTKP